MVFAPSGEHLLVFTRKPKTDGLTANHIVRFQYNYNVPDSVMIQLCCNITLRQHLQVCIARCKVCKCIIGDNNINKV